MALEHKAFLFDYSAFRSELLGALEKALGTNECHELVAFIQQNLGSLTDPYEGEPLPADWNGLLECRDAHQYGDFALTKYYDPKNDIGLGTNWGRVEEAVIAGLGDATILLGTPVGPQGKVFDPGKAGAYFQSEEEVEKHLGLLDAAVSRTTSLGNGVRDLHRILRTAVADGKGLYVTF